MTELRPETREMVAKATGLLLDGIFTSQVWDSSGEVLDLEGCDISEMEEGRGTANWEHRNDDSPGASASDTVGKIVYVKKVFKAEDCEDDRQRFFWAKVKAPYLYGIVRLYDGAGHAAAKDLAAQVRDAVANDEPIMVRFSIDGSTLERKGNQLKVTVARKVALTLKPCNKTCDSGLLADPNAPEGFEKEPKLVKSEDPLYGTLGWGEWVEQTLPQATLAKAADKASRNHWVSEDGVKVPKKGSPERLRYDAAFEKQVTKVFGPGKKVKVPVESSTPHNSVRNYDRLQLYSDMLKGKDRLPPIVVRQGAFGWDVLDGSHRWAAAKAAGVTHLDAIDVTGQKVQKTAPSMLTGQAALTREDLSKRVESVLKSWDESKGPLKEFLKSQLSDVDPKYVQHFVDAADNIRAQLRKSQGQQDLGYHVLLSGDNPKHPDSATMKLDNPGLVSHLQAHGEDVVSTEGRYDGLDERSMMVRNPKDLNHILDVATKLGQDSVIVSHGGKHQYVYLHGPNKGMAYHGEGTVWHPQKPDDYYTSLPDGSHFTHQFDWSKAHPFSQGLTKSEEDEPKVDPKAPLTVRGQPVSPNPDIKPGEMHFNEHTGTLKTPKGTFTLYQPDKDGKSGEHFRQVWSSPHVRSQHDYAIRNWIKVNSALREGKLPEAVLATATAFSQLSPNTAVPTHELMYSVHQDTILTPHRGAPKKAQDFAKGDQIWGVDDSGKRVVVDVVGVHDHGLLQGWEVTFDDGYSLICSSQHKFLTLKGMAHLHHIVRMDEGVLCAKKTQRGRMASKVRADVFDRSGLQGTSQGVQRLQGGVVGDARGEWPPPSDRESRALCSIEGVGSSSATEVVRGQPREVGRGLSKVATRESGALRRTSGPEGRRDERMAQGASRRGTRGVPEAHRRGTQVPPGTSRGVRGQRTCAGAFSQGPLGKLQAGDVPTRQRDADMASGSYSMRSRTEASGLRIPRSQDLGRGRRVLSLQDPEGYREATGETGPGTVSGRDVERGGEKTGRRDIDPAFCRLLQSVQGPQVPLEGLAYSDAPLSSTRGLVLRKIVRVRAVGIVRMCDLEVAHPKHNFLLPNGVVTSNSHLLDTQKKFGIDTRSPEFASQKVRRDWLARDKPQSWPESSRSYFTDQIPSLVTVQADSKTTGRKAGDRVSFALANNKFDNMSRYADVHGVMRDLVSRHGVDGRAAVKEMMDAKVASTLWEAARKRHVEKGNPDIGPYKGPNVPGLAPKTARFTYAMLGSGNSFVPDTHFARHLFGLDKALDSPTIHHLRDEVLWNPKNSELLGAMDRWYYRNHPAVQLMLNHPEFGDYFKANPEQAVFGGFWGHWLSIKKHEELQGHRSAGVGSNQSASHRPFFDEIDRLMSDPKESKLTIPARTSPLATSPKPQDSLVFSTRQGRVKKSEAPDHGGSMIDPHLAAQMLAGWVRDHGEGEAMLRYYLHLVPLLMHEGHEAEDQGIELAKADALSVEVLRLAKAAADGTAPGWKMAADGSMVQRPKVKAQVLPHTAEIDPKGRHAQNDSWEARYGTRPHDARTEVNEAVFDSELHGHVLNQTPEQKALIHGVRVHNQADRPADETANPVLFVPHPDGQRRVVAKNDVNSHTNGVAREVGYYNLARDFFGLGHYLPTTAGARHPDGKSNWSFSEMIPNARHWDENDQGQHQVLRDLGDRGELHKMAFMNAVLGNSDRHLNNFMFDERPGEQPLKLIDHGHAFTTTNEPTMNWSKSSAAINGIAPTPGYLSAYMQAAPHASHELHPAARQWIEAMRPEDLHQRATAMGLGQRTADWLARNLQANKDHFLKGKGTVRGVNVPVDKED